MSVFVYVSVVPGSRNRNEKNVNNGKGPILRLKVTRKAWPRREKDKRKDEGEEEGEAKSRIQSCDTSGHSFSFSASPFSSSSSFADKLPQRSRFSDSTALDLARTRDTIDRAISPLS